MSRAVARGRLDGVFLAMFNAHVSSLPADAPRVSESDPELTAAWWPFCRVARAGPADHGPVAVARPFDSPVAALGGVLLDLYPLALDTPIDEFEPRLFDLLQRGIAFDSGWVGRAALTPGGPVMHNSCLYRLPLECALDWERLKLEDPLAGRLMARSGRPLRMSVDDARMTAAFRAYVRKYALAHALVCFADDPILGLHAFLSLYRRDVSRPFSEDDVTFVAAVMPHIASATNLNRIHQIAQIKAGMGPVRSAMALCDGFGTLQFAERTLADFMRMEWPDWTGPVLPPEIALGPSGTGKSGFVGSQITVEVRHVAELVVIQVRKRSPVADLTPKERQVTGLFASGLTYKEVARRLDLSPATVKHHLRNAYLKLGVADKGKIAWLLSQDSAS